MKETKKEKQRFNIILKTILTLSNSSLPRDQTIKEETIKSIIYHVIAKKISARHHIAHAEEMEKVVLETASANDARTNLRRQRSLHHMNPHMMRCKIISMMNESIK